MNNYYIVILNWNGWHDTRLCIDSILNRTSSNRYSIVLVDNGSSMDEVREIESYCRENFKYVISENKEYFLNSSVEILNDFHSHRSQDRILIIKNNENLGFAAGNNVALQFLKNINEHYAILLNNDTEIEHEALDKMYQFLLDNEKKDVVAVIPQIRYYNPNNIIWNCGGSINWLGVRKYDYAFDNIDKVPQQGAKRVDYGTGCALMMNINKTGVLSEKFFLGEEDMEFAFRLKKMNTKIFCLYPAIIYHKVGASRSKISEEKMGNMVYHYSMRMSNLKDNLPTIVWYLTMAAHYLSTIRILKKEQFFSIKKVNLMWKDIYKNVKTIDKYKREDFIRITNKKY
ncbi:MAG: glycosyl transferase family 2 [Sphingobacterium sp.]|nr:glycosyl transferase family 2 [Sphingobacterium sp.]